MPARRDGNVKKTAAEVASLHGPVLGHYATEDQWIDASMVAGFEASMQAAGKSVTSHWYEVRHDFANPTTARYDGADATLARERTIAFFDGVLSDSTSASHEIASAA